MPLNDITDEGWKAGVAAARDWARVHGQPQPDDRMLDHFGRAYHQASGRGVATCVFCDIVAGRAPADMVAAIPDSIAFRPLNPVVPGHVLVVPKVHVRDAAEDPDITAATMRHAAVLASIVTPGQFNLITSAGSAATQTVFHLHVHIVPRIAGDGLLLPWQPVDTPEEPQP
jgi:histidine triad (HIT) family protein